MPTMSVGHIQEFDPSVESLSTYLECMEQYFEANDIQEGKMKSVLVSFIGAK